ncbi:MAG: pyrroline-5-carboxylate reductase dimerization domain-containing protein [Flavobacteriales bacterium AspAUS03]
MYLLPMGYFGIIKVCDQRIMDCSMRGVEMSEELMEATTVLGVCNISFVFQFIRSMLQGDIEVGFDAVLTFKMVNQTVKGP